MRCAPPFAVQLQLKRVPAPRPRPNPDVLLTTSVSASLKVVCGSGTSIRRHETTKELKRVHSSTQLQRQDSSKNLKLTAGGFYGMLIILLSAWILQAFLEALLAGC